MPDLNKLHHEVGRAHDEIDLKVHLDARDLQERVVAARAAVRGESAVSAER